MLSFNIFLSALLFPTILLAQTSNQNQGGNFSLGVRTTLSAFGHGSNELGYGTGGQFRIQITDRVNTEWFLDILSTNIHNKAQRMDYHIGWSVMYYIIDPKEFTKKITPYVVAGHCFDHTRVSINGSNEPPHIRWSSAVQTGMGFHCNITPKLDVSPTLQYMLHLGGDIHVHESETDMRVEDHNGAGLEGHLLFNVSMNYKFLRLWKPKKS